MKHLLLSLAFLFSTAAGFGIVPATVKLHDLDPQWRFVHGYWQGTCVDIDEHGDGGTPYARHVVASTSGSEYLEQLIKAGDSSWTTDVQGEIDYLQSSKTTVEFKSTGTNGVLSRTTAAGNDNAMHTFFYDKGGVLTHSRQISFRKTAGVMRRIVSTQSFTDGFAPSGLAECKDVKLASRAAADEALASDSLPGTSAPELFAAVATADEPFIHPYAQCDTAAVVLADYPQWAAENGYWVGDLSFFSGDLAPNYDPAYLNYPFDHYKGFITGSVEGGSYSQRNTFLYKPQTATRCAENNATYVDDETCGTMGTANLFQADQTTEYCNQKEGGRISGPDSKNWNGTYPTITTLIGTQAVLYQVWGTNTNGDSVFYQSQMTTITYSADGQVRRTRTAQFWDLDSGEARQFSFYRALKVPESTFWTQFNATMIEYEVSAATIDKRCGGGFGNLKQFMEGSIDWDGDKYSCPLPTPVITGSQPLSVWTTTGVSGWAGFYPDDPVTAGLYLTAEQLAKVPGGTVAGLSGYGWVDTLTSPEAVWTTTGVGGWAGFYPNAPVTAGLRLTAEQLAKVPPSYGLAGLSSYGWIDILAMPSATWTAAGVTGWATYYPSNPMTAGAFLTAGQLAQVPSATVELLHGYGWVDTLAV